MLIRRLARPLLASTFVANGVDTLIHPNRRVEQATTLVHTGEETLPTDIASKLPSDPSALVRVTAVAQLTGGTLLALGKAPRLAALTLAATVVPTTVTEQNFWAEDDPELKAAKRNAFLKDVGLLGGLIIASADTEGKPSLGWRGRRAARSTAATVSDALPFGKSDSESADAVREQLHNATERSRDIAGAAGTKGAALAETVQQRGPGWAETAKHRGGEFADVAKHRGAEFAEVAKHRGSALAETAQTQGPEWAGTAKHRGAELAEVAKHRGGAVGEVAKHRGTELTAATQQHGPAWAERVKKTAAANGAKQSVEANGAKQSVKADRAKRRKRSADSGTRESGSRRRGRSARC